MTATASTTAIDGSTVQASVTFYIEGATGGVPNANITTQLDQLYTASSSYPKDGSATSNLMTGVAMHESNYTQFRTPAECNFDLWSLDKSFGILAKWPYESEVSGPNNQCVSDGGTHIGLMQIATAPNQTADPNAWKWADQTPTAAANANDAVNLFSGTPTPNKMTIASSYENDIFSGVKTPKIPAHVGMDSTRTPLSGLQFENMALVLYRGAGLGPDLASTLMELYYIPVCTPPGAISSSSKGWTCSTKWYWAVNDPTVDQNVQVKYIFPPKATGAFGNHVGVVYVSNGILLNDANFGPGVRKQLQQ